MPAPKVETEADEQQELEKSQKKTKKLPVIEIFGPTIQGEGPLTGSKTMFVRFGGCDFRCTMCDSLHAVIPAAVKQNATRLSEEEIVEKLVELRGQSGTCWVTLSGGNPAMWDLKELVKRCNAVGLAVAVETQGSLWQDWFPDVQMLVLSPKTPGMGEKCDMQKLTSILTRMRMAGNSNIAIKTVIFSQQDIDFSLELESHVTNLITPGMLFFSLGNSYVPKLQEDGQLVSPIDADEHRLKLLKDYRILAEDMLQDHRIQHWRFFPQLHVLIWSNEGEK